MPRRRFPLVLSCLSTSLNADRAPPLSVALARLGSSSSETRTAGHWTTLCLLLGNWHPGPAIHTTPPLTRNLPACAAPLDRLDCGEGGSRAGGRLGASPTSTETASIHFGWGRGMGWVFCCLRASSFSFACIACGQTKKKQGRGG